MSREQITELVKVYIDQSAQGIEIENPKFDFKFKWYDLKSTSGLSEFLKDSSSMANTFGPDGYIVIGFNDKTKVFHSSPFKESGLGDTSALPDIISRHIDRPFLVNYYEMQHGENILGILHFPPSIDKPHFIRNYKIEKNGNVREEHNKVFIRKNSQTYTANKYDFELMVYDRKNILPEYELHCSFHRDAFSLDYRNMDGGEYPIPVKIVLNIENSGRRPVSVCGFKVTLSEFSDFSDHEVNTFNSSGLLNTFTLIVQSGEIAKSQIDLYSEKFYTYRKGNEIFSSIRTNMRRLPMKSFELTLTNGKIITGELTITD